MGYQNAEIIILSLLGRKRNKSQSNLKDRQQQALPAEGYRDLFPELSGPFHHQITDKNLTGNLTASWGHKYLRKWTSSLSSLWLVLLFLSTQRQGNKKRWLICCHWRTAFASTGIWLLTLLNKQAAGGIVQSKQNRRFRRKARQMSNL